VNAEQTPSPRVISLRYPSACTVCDAELARRTRAWWYSETKKIVCLECGPETASANSRGGRDGIKSEQDPAAESTTNGGAATEPLKSDGDAGASARREGERRRVKRERETLARHPRVGKLMLALSDEPQHVRSWSQGAVGEETLGARFSKLATERLVILHDRRVPGSRANIDHIAITPGGVFVIDAKHYSGRVEKRNLGGWLSKDLRLYVGRRDCTKLVLSSEDQAEIVRDAVRPLGFADIPIRPVLCFVGAEWGTFASPFKHGPVLVTWPKFLYALLKKEADVETEAIQETARLLAQTLPRA
jgi:hypothetical protein